MCAHLLHWAECRLLRPTKGMGFSLGEASQLPGTAGSGLGQLVPWEMTSPNENQVPSPLLNPTILKIKYNLHC